MGNTIIRTVKFRDILEQAYTYTTDYVDEEIFVAGSIDDIIGVNTAVRLDFSMIVFCKDGSMQINLNNIVYKLSEGDMLFCMPSVIISDVHYSEDVNVQILGLSISFVNRIVHGEHELTYAFSEIHANPMRRLGPDCEHKVEFLMYKELINEKINDEKGFFRKKILNHIFSAMFCDILAEVTAGMQGNAVMCGIETKRAYYLFKRFLKELSKDDGRHRTLGYYADLLCYTPKYVSLVVKQVSGRTAMSWINGHVMEQIKYHLLHSDKSIKEISELFDFPNMSFFGKYVKRNIGISPTAYRRQAGKVK